MLQFLNFISKGYCKTFYSRRINIETCWRWHHL